MVPGHNGQVRRRSQRKLAFAATDDAVGFSPQKTEGVLYNLSSHACYIQADAEQ